MIDLFRKKSTPGPGQDSSSLPAKTKDTKREYSYLLEFRCRGQLFATLETNTVKEGVLRIGKNPGNDLVIPDTDRISSEKHLELHFSSGTLRVLAVSGNYFYCNSRKNTSASLKLYDRISFGDCELNVKEGADDDAAFSRRHRLEFTNSAKRGEVVLLEKEEITIGSAPENDIVLKDDVVSRFHARIRITENGECWIKDLQSINGTTVNDVKLDTQERMLMDSDEISFASVTMMFLDRRVCHTRSQIGRKFLIMGITIAVAALICGLFYAVTPQASQLLLAAEYYTARGEFDAAQRMLDKMSNAKGYSNFKEYSRSFSEKLTRYRNTMALWKEFKTNLEKSRWAAAIGNCGMLEENNRSAWDWSEEEAEKNIQELKYAKMLLNLHSDIQSLLHSTAQTPEEKKQKVAELKKKELPPLKDEISWLQPLRKRIAENSKKLYDSIEVWRKAERLLEQSGEKNSDLTFIIAEMDKLHAVAVGSVRTRIFNIIGTLKQLQANDSAIEKNRRAIQSMELNGVSRMISFVSQDDCLLNRQLIRKRAHLIDEHRKIIEIAGNIRLQYQKLCSLAGKSGKLPGSIEEMVKEEHLRAMVEMPALTGSRSYDHFFGARYFFRVMNESAAAGDNIYSDELLTGVKNIPVCVQLKKIFNAAETAHIYLQTLKKSFPVKDGLAAFDEKCCRLLQKRSRLIRFFRERALQSKDERAWLIATAAVFYFTPSGSAAQSDLKKFSEKWKTYQIGMQRLVREYDPLDSRKMNNLRQQIRLKGIPGDPAAALLRSVK